jgi:predicted NAD/FAD-binding protein
LKIAIVGAGVSGLVVAHRLHERHDVTVFEEAPRIGGHTNTVRVDLPDATHQVDTGFIVHNDRNYPRFEALMAKLGVATQPSVMTFGVADERGEFEYSSASANGLFATRSHLVSPRFHRMVAEIPRFQREARALLDDGTMEGVSLGDWLEERRFSLAFVERLIVPQVSAVWSADPREMWRFPVRFLFRFFSNHGMLGLRDRPTWRTVTGGSQRYVDALVRPWEHRIRTATPVRAIHRHEDHVTVTPEGGEAERFDEVVLAVHADQALRMLADANATEHALLRAIPYQDNEAVLHTDRTLLPRRRRAWASWNYHLLDEPPARTTVTYHMNTLQSLRSDAELCVTLNRTDAIDPAHVLRTFRYAHPVYTSEGIRAQARHGEISGRNRTHFCGAYWGWGFHEDGVVSGERVADALERSPA